MSVMCVQDSPLIFHYMFMTFERQDVALSDAWLATCNLLQRYRRLDKQAETKVLM